MGWIAHREFEGKTLSEEMHIYRGENLEYKNGILLFNNKPVCFARSQMAKEHFSPNTDGCGLKRGRITYYIAFGPKLTDLQKSILRSDPSCRRFLANDDRVILFNDSFFSAPMMELYTVCMKLGVEL